jgi:hypothetical protein
MANQGEQMSGKTRKIVELIGVMVGIVLAAVSCWYAAQANATADAANRTAEQAIFSAARTEITGYAAQMVELDRAADARNGIQISVLAEQARSVLDQYGEAELRLAPATYRVLAEFAALDVENREVARNFAASAIRAAHQQKNLIEEIRAERALATSYAQDGNVTVMTQHLDRALGLSRSKTDKVQRDSTRFTGSQAIYLALLAAQAAEHGSKNYMDACQSAVDYEKRFRIQLTESWKARSLEVSRRAYSVKDFGTWDEVKKDDVFCGRKELSGESLHMAGFTRTWICNPVRRQLRSPESCAKEL